MCWSFRFALPASKAADEEEKKKKKKKKRRESANDRLPHPDVVCEKRRWRDGGAKQRSGETARHDGKGHWQEAPHFRHSRKGRWQEAPHLRHDHHRPAVQVQVPDMSHRLLVADGSSSSQEALLNPRPQRSQHTRRRHPKRTSQTTLRGRGAKRDPPPPSKSNKAVSAEPSRPWSFFAPSPPRTPKRNRRAYQALDTASRRASPRAMTMPDGIAAPAPAPPPPPSHHVRQYERQGRARTPNTAARRMPDRRFAVLAATNQALEDVRREAFAHASPPPRRRERLRRYEGVAIPTSTIPFNWDCLSSSQASASHAQPSARPGHAPASHRHSRPRR